jgi:predicted aminopeptidase
MQTRYVLQAGLGQGELWSLARPVSQVLNDPRVDERTKALLREANGILSYAEGNGLSRKGNYGQYVELDRGAVVWFLAAAQPLKLEAEKWRFPLVGSFPYLGWFDATEARQIRERLKRRGLDVYMRPVHAFSTGGWLDDPILSTMLSPDEDAFRYLTNILLHELTHANIFINNQTNFNESIASFVGDTMAEQYLEARFGKESQELAKYREELDKSRTRGARFAQAYKLLEKLYASKKSERSKLAEKQKITRGLMLELDLRWQPNNASLLGFKTYNTGMEEFEKLFTACGHKWKPFFAAIKTLNEDSFDQEQHEAFGPIITSLESKCVARR